MDYYVLAGLESRGPFSADELRAQGLSPETLVWRKGLAAWTRADAVDELRGWWAPPPPAPPANPYASPRPPDLPPWMAPGPAVPHSGLGIASVVVGVIGIFGIGSALALATSLAMAKGGQVDENSPMMMTVGLLVCAGFPLNIAGVGLGIAAVLQANRRRTFAMVGLTLNAVFLVVMGGLMLVGLAVS
jgi:hypothetical protein